MNTILRDARTNEMPALKSALVALESVDVPDRNAAIAGLADHVKHLTALHDETAVSMAQPKAAQRSGIAEEMFKAADDLIKFIDKLSTQLTLSTKLQDPYIDQLMELKQLAWMVRNAAGDAAVLSSYALQGRPQTTANVEDYIGKVSKVRATWAALEDLANGLPLPGAFAQMRDKVNREYFGSDYIDSGMKAIKDALAGQPPAMTVDQQTAIGMTRLTPLVGLAEVALETARQHALSQHAAALRNLIIQFVLLIGAIALFVGAMLVVTKRVTRPLQKLSEAMRKLAGGDSTWSCLASIAPTKSARWRTPSSNSRFSRSRKRGARPMRRRSVSMPKPKFKRGLRRSSANKAEAQAQAAEGAAEVVRFAGRTNLVEDVRRRPRPIVWARASPRAIAKSKTISTPWRPACRTQSARSS